MNLIFFATLFVGCSTSWTKVIGYGQVTEERFEEEVDITLRRGLIFVPVMIKGKSYNFLFDSGAPFSISEELQDIFNFDVVSRGNIVDSDNNRTKVEWCQVSEVKIGDIGFTDVSAFIGDFTANPFLDCLEIDGILGSNLLRLCNWEVDQERMTITLFNKPDFPVSEGSLKVPFTYNQQYSMYIDLDIGRAAIEGVLVDFGSNGTVSLSDKIFSQLQQANIIDDVLIQVGKKRSGIVGKSIDLKRKITYSDSVKIDNYLLNDLSMRTGKGVSIGNGLLEDFRVTIHWAERMLYLSPIENEIKPRSYAGFALAISEDLGIHVGSIIQGSNAFSAGLRPGMQVVRLDNLNFKGGDTFCDYIDHEISQEIYVEAKDSTGTKMEVHFEKTSR